MAAKKIGITKVRQTLKEIVAEKGADYVYKGPSGRCVNFNPARPSVKRPSCIAGHVYVRLGLVTNTDQARAIAFHGAHDANFALGSPLTTAAESYLGAVQHLQDIGTPWGEAIKVKV